MFIGQMLPPELCCMSVSGTFLSLFLKQVLSCGSFSFEGFLGHYIIFLLLLLFMDTPFSVGRFVTYAIWKEILATFIFEWSGCCYMCFNGAMSIY